VFRSWEIEYILTVVLSLTTVCAAKICKVKLSFCNLYWYVGKTLVRLVEATWGYTCPKSYRNVSTCCAWTPRAMFLHWLGTVRLLLRLDIPCLQMSVKGELIVRQWVSLLVADVQTRGLSSRIQLIQIKGFHNSRLNILAILRGSN
jgi:hypothetical protein